MDGEGNGDEGEEGDEDDEEGAESPGGSGAAGGQALCGNVSHYKNENAVNYFNLEFESVDQNVLKDMVEEEGKKIDEIIIDVIKE